MGTMMHQNSLLTDMYSMDDVKASSSAALSPGSTHVSTVDVINMYDEPDLPIYAGGDPKDEKRYCGNRLTKRGVIAIALIVAVLVFVIALAAAIPSIGYSIASSAVADADMQIKTLDVITLTDDTMVVRLQGAVINKANMDGTMSEFEMSLYYGGKLVGTGRMPEQHVKANSPTPMDVTTTLHFSVDQREGAVAMGLDMLLKDKFDIQVEGELQLQAQGMTFSGVPFNKVVSLKGMNGLTDVSVNTLDMTSSTADAIRFSLNVTIFNPSDVSIYIGDRLNMIAYTVDEDKEPLRLGVAVAENVLLARGLCNFTMRGELDMTQDLTAVIKNLNRYIVGNSMIVSATPDPDGSGINSWLMDSILQAWSISAVLPGFSEKLVRSVDFEEMTIEPTGDSSIHYAASAVVGFRSPLGPDCPLDIRALSVDAFLLDDAGAAMLPVVVPIVQIKYVEKRQEMVILNVTLEADIVFTAASTANAFAQYVNKVLYADVVLGAVSGTTNAVLDVGPLGIMQLDGLPLYVDTEMPGMDGLKKNDIIDFTLTDSTSEAIVVNALVASFNPSIFRVKVGVFRFDSYYEGEYMGGLLAQGVTINPGENSIQFMGEIVPTNVTAAVDMFNKFMFNQTVNFECRAPDNAFDSALLNMGFAGFSLTVEVPPFKEKLINNFVMHHITMSFPTHSSVAVSTRTTIGITNPLGPNAPLQFDSLSLTAQLIEDSTGNVLIEMSATPDIAGGSADSLELDIQDTFAIGEDSAIPAFMQNFVAQPSVTLRLRGLSDAVVNMPFGQVPMYNIPLDEAITIPGIDSNAVRIESFDLTQSTGDAIVIVVAAVLPNPSFATVMLGDIAFDIVYQGAKVGFLNAIDLVLVPGDNTVIMSGQIAPEEDAIPATEALFSAYMAGKTLNVAARASANASPNPIINEGLQGFELNVPMPGTTEQLVTGFTFSALSLAPYNPPESTKRDDDSASRQLVAFGTTAHIGIQSPLGPDATLLVKTISINADVFDTEDNLIGHLWLEEPVEVISSTSTKVDVALPTILDITESAQTFGHFTHGFVHNASVALRIVGTATVTAQTSVGELEIGGIPLDQSVTMEGVGGLDNMQIVAFDLPGNGPNDDTLVIEVTAALNNPSIATLNIGDLAFDIFYQGSYQGTVMAENFVFVPGMNTLSAVGYLKPAAEDLELTSQFMSRYLRGEDTLTTLAGSPLASAPWLHDLIGNLALAAVLPGAEDLRLIDSIGLIPQLEAKVMDAPPYQLRGNVTATMRNPFDFPVTVTEYTMTMTLADPSQSNKVFGSVPVDWTVVPPPISGGTGPVQVLKMGFDANLNVADTTIFKTYMTRLLSTTSAPMKATGQADVRVSTAIGVLTLYGVAFDASLPVTGFNKLPNIQVSDISVVGATSNVLNIQTTARIPSSADVDATLSALQFDILVPAESNGLCGTAVGPNPMVIKKGAASVNQNTLSGSLNKNLAGFSTAAMRKLLSNYLNRVPTPIKLRGSNIPNTPSVVQAAISGVMFDATMPGTTVKVVQKADYKGWNVVWCFIVPCDIEISTDVHMRNPLDIALKVTAMNIKVYYRLNNAGNSINDYTHMGNVNKSGLNINISANGSAVYSTKIDNELNVFTLLDVKDSSAAKYAGLSGTLTVNVDGFVATLDILDFGIPFNM